MIYITSHLLRASEKGDIHAFLLVRLLTNKDTECEVLTVDIGKNGLTITNIMSHLPGYIKDRIVRNGCFYLDGKIKQVSSAARADYFNHKGADYQVK